MQRTSAAISDITNKPRASASSVHLYKGKYPYRLNFYDKPPLYDVSLTEFETAAIDRLRVLSEIEASFVRGRSNEDLKAVVDAQCEKYLPLHRDGRSDDKELERQRKKDHIGHFVLRLAFCRSTELRTRFAKLETSLFKLRFESDDRESRDAFMSERNFSWETVSKQELEDESEGGLKRQLEAFNNSLPLSQQAHAHDQWHKIRWTKVPELVEKRRVVLKGGWAYVPSKEKTSLVCREFQTHLEKALVQTAKVLPRLDEDTRLIPVLDHLCQGFANGLTSVSDYKMEGHGSGDVVSAEMVDELAQKHWPMCMRHLQDTLRRDRHLKHYGRLQYGLFLKGMGLSIEEAIVFWRKAFGGSLTDDKFNKEYKYNIRHSYGLEGKRADYPPYNCQRIITQNAPGPNECHGCPYRHFSADRLQTALIATYGTQGLSSSDMPEIMHAVKSGHYHVACTRVYEITHKLAKGQGLDGESVSHPNRYAAKSRELEKSRSEGVKVEEDVEML